MLPRVIGEHIKIAVVPSVERVPVLADPTQIQLILMNLATNARDAMPKGGKLTIKVADCEMKQGSGGPADVAPGHYVTLTVSDTGVGMSPEIQSRVFDPFFTTKDLGKGTGLGLSAVYGVVKESGGSILLNSKVGEGTTFRIYLPRAMEEIIGRDAASRVSDESLQGSENSFWWRIRSNYVVSFVSFCKSRDIRCWIQVFRKRPFRLRSNSRGNLTCC